MEGKSVFRIETERNLEERVGHQKKMAAQFA